MGKPQTLCVQDVRTLGRPLAVLPSHLSRLSSDAQDRLRQSSALAPVKKGQLLIRTGDFFGHVLFVQSGWVAGDVDGVTVTLLSANSFYLISAGSQNMRPAHCDLRALTSGYVAVIDKEVIWPVLRDEPDVLIDFCDRIAQSMNRLNTEIARRAKLPLELRLASFLWEMGSPTPSGARQIPNEIPQAEIASYLGASREEVSRKKAMLTKAGYLYKENDIWLMDTEPSIGLS